jgi:hypothetical protein
MMSFRKVNWRELWVTMSMLPSLNLDVAMVGIYPIFLGVVCNPKFIPSATEPQQQRQQQEM